MSTQQKIQEELTALAHHLYLRRNAVLEAWRARVDQDTDLTSGSGLSRTAFNDHIPEILDAFARRLRAWPDEIGAQVRGLEIKGVAAHGLHRWQQGFRLRELTREWGYLQLAVIDELESYVAAHSGLDPIVLATALRSLTHLCVAGVSDGVEQFWQLQQTEAAGRLRELEQAVVTVREIESARAAGWHQATHDLRGGVSVVSMASTVLNDDEALEPDRRQAAEVLRKSVLSLHDMLDSLVDLARLDAGHEHRVIAPLDASALLNDFCAMMQPTAAAHDLFLKCEGPPTLPVEGDRAKVRRIIQNLVLNAIKYTQHGGVIVSWEDSKEADSRRWMVSVQDSGSGFDGTLHGSVVNRLREATQGAQLLEARALSEGTSSNQDEPAVTMASQSPGHHPDTPLQKHTGEGIGLSIVKGLCDLLDATLEVESSAGQGTTFRVTFPCSYPE